MSNDSNVRVPPSFGEGKRWLLREVTWTEQSPDAAKPSACSAMIGNGMKVSEQLHDAYWNAKSESEYAIAACRVAGVTGLPQYVLLDDKNRIMGWGCFNPSDGPDEIAWLTCWFLELRGWKSGLVVPKGVHVPDASKVHVADT